MLRCIFCLLILCFSQFNLFSQQINPCAYSSVFFSPSYSVWYPEAIAYVNNDNGRKRSLPADTNFVIPVVFHFLYPQGKTVETEMINQRIKQLNLDFAYQNSDSDKLRSIFRSRVGDTRIRFQLASTDPAGNASPGYTYRKTELKFGPGNLSDYKTYHRMKFDTCGGRSAWDTKRYLNIWVCDLRVSSGAVYSAGFATPPFKAPKWDPIYYGDSLIDGVVLDFWGYDGTQRGTTLTHEVGHYLGLRHTSGDPPQVVNDSVACEIDDSIYDTPSIRRQNYYTCDHSLNTCTEDSADMPDMLENYMDYTGDGCRVAFTGGQIKLMQYCLLTLRKDLSQTQIKLKPLPPDFNVYIFPNPAGNALKLEFKDSGYINSDCEIYDALGNLILKQALNSLNTSLDISHLAAAFYFVRIKDSAGLILKTEKILKY